MVKQKKEVPNIDGTELAKVSAMAIEEASKRMEKQDYDHNLDTLGAGDILTVDGGLNDLLEILSANAVTARLMMLEGARQLEHADKDLWNSIHDAFPELKQYHMIYDREEGQIQIMYRKTTIAEVFEG